MKFKVKIYDYGYVFMSHLCVVKSSSIEDWPYYYTFISNDRRRNMKEFRNYICIMKILVLFFLIEFLFYFEVGGVGLRNVIVNLVNEISLNVFCIF